jgi:hypothetical protein
MVSMLVDAGVQKKNIAVFEFDKSYGLQVSGTEGYKFEMFPLFHDVENAGFKIDIFRKGRAFYATDTSKILTEAKDYDLYLVEANYEDEEAQERIDQQIIDGKDFIHEYKAMRNHMSEKDAIDFITANAGAKSEYVLMHVHEAKEDKGDGSRD